jgi:hypothetical protein
MKKKQLLRGHFFVCLALSVVWDICIWLASYCAHDSTNGHCFCVFISYICLLYDSEWWISFCRQN